MLVNQDFILLILNCKSYKHKAIKQRNTWLKSLPPFLKYYHVIGDERLNVPFVFDNVDNILFVKTKDDYISLPHKVISAFKAVKETFNYKYIFKTDDDQRLLKGDFFNLLANTLSEKKLITSDPNKIHYGGKAFNIGTHSSTYHLEHRELPSNIILHKTIYCTGRFYFISKEAVDNLLLKADNFKKEYFEDYSVGYYLSPEFKKNILSMDTGKFFSDNM